MNTILTWPQSSKMSTSQMMGRLRPFGINFDKSLEDLIKGIRSNSGKPDKLSEFLDNSIQECKNELKTGDMEEKSMAILKLAYLEMYGYDMGWCCFYILEVMTSPKFQHKRIGYLAATQIMQRQNNDDALMLMTNQLKKDLNSSNHVECGLAIGCVSSIVDTELAQDTCDDMIKTLHHSKPYIRKRAILCMYKIFLKYPDALRTYFDQVVDMLDDPDTLVVSATVNVICELAHANPRNYIDLAPRLYGLMKDTSNNWMVIRLLKLFSSLSLVEPRLKTKLLPEIVQLMQKTDALSLVYECINAILSGNMLDEDDEEVAGIIIKHLLSFFQSDDQNLKYVGLLAFIKTCRIHKELIKDHDKILLSCLYDDDITIRETSLEIVNYLVSEKNIVTIVARLLVQLTPYSEQSKRLNAINNETDDAAGPFSTGKQQPLVVSESYRLRAIEKIIEVCSSDNYGYIPNFRWYLGVLSDIIKLNIDNRIAGVDSLVTTQLMDIGVRVPSIRAYLVSTCLDLCISKERTVEELSSFYGGLKDCMWIIAEYYREYLEFQEEDDDDDDEPLDEFIQNKATVATIVDSISQQSLLSLLAENEEDMTLPVYIQSVAKLFSRFCELLGGYWRKEDFEDATALCNSILDWLSNFTSSTNFEVQERSVSFTEVLRLVVDALSADRSKLESDSTLEPPKFITQGYWQLFGNTEIRPVSKALQRTIPVPEDIELDKALDATAMSRFVDILASIEVRDAKLAEEMESEDSSVDQNSTDTESEEGEAAQVDSKEEERRRKERQERLKDDPFYIQDEESKELVPKVAEEAPKKRVSKPKKIRREKVLVLDEEGSTGTPVERKKRASLGKFMVDSTSLEKVDLKAEPVETTPEGGYEIEEAVKEMRASVSVGTPAAPAEPASVSITRKKPKKKKKKAVIN